MSNQTEWRWADPAGQQRLVREEELRAALASGAIPSNAPVWTRGWKEWKPAHEVAELRGALAPNGGGDVPPPPLFIVAAQDAFEGKPSPTPTGPAEPPPPPRYVPIEPQTQPHIPPAPASDTKVDQPRPAAGVARPPTPAPAAKPPHLPSKPPPLPAKALTKPPLNKTAPMVAKPVPAAAASKPAPPTTKVASKPRPLPQQSAFRETQRPPMGVAPPSEELPASGRHTLQVAPAPPPLPKLDAMPVVAPPPPTQPLPKETLQKEASSKHPTLMMFEPNEPSQKLTVPESSAPIMVPANEPSAVTNAVTRPPPWGEGAVQMDTQIPKSPAMPTAVGAMGERPSEAPPRPVELSSSDLSSEARIAVVKASPLMPAERPHGPHGTMMGMGMLPEEQARKATPPPVTAPPLSQSDVASTSKWAPQPAPRTPPSGAKVHDLRAMGRPSIVSAASAFANRTYATLRERTKHQPPWFLPAIAVGGSTVVLILAIVIVKAAIGSGSSGETTGDAMAVTTTTSTSTSLFPFPPFPPPTKATATPRAMTCQTAGPTHTVAPKALISSGVEVAAVAPQVALGFAVAPKEAALEVLEAGNLASASALHLHAADNVRRVLALDASKAAVDSDHKGDRIQGRRTVRANPPIDLGAMDGGLVWAPHGSDKGIKLWSLVNPDAPVEALRGEPFSTTDHGAGFVVTFRAGGAVWYGAFAGNPPAPLAPLTHVDGLGPQVGSPAIASSGDNVMLAWADRASPNDFWSIRYLSFKLGDEGAPQAKAFPLPSGGLGEQAMSPAVTPLGSGRFLLVWTEGPVSNHQVRSAVINGGVASNAFTVSADGINAGQGQAAVLPDGRGVIAFLSASQTAKGFEVAATPIQCVEK